MSGPKPYRVIRDVLDLALQTGAPLIVRRRCTPHQLAVWMALRCLIDTTERTAFGSREIADEAGLKSFPRVAGWLAELVDLGLLEIAGYEEVRGGDINEGKHDRPIYRIPWKQIYSDSLIEAEKYVAGLVNKRRRGRPSEGHELQLAMDFPVTEGSRTPLPIDHGDALPIGNGLRDRSITEVRDRSVTARDRSVTASVTDRSHVGREVSREVGINARTRESLPIPPTPPDEWALSAHPVDIWQSACPDHRPIDLKHLAALVKAHDTPTGGFGLYWVGRAILAASLSSNIRSIKAVKTVLDRWAGGQGYGTDTPAYERRKERYGQQRSERPDPAGNGPDGSRRSDRSQDRQRPSGKDRPPRPGDPAYYAQYLEDSTDGPADGE